MKRRAALDVALLGVLAPIWVVCLLLHLERIHTGRLAWFPFYFEPAASADAYPVFRRWNPELPRSEAELSPGDTLVQVGQAELRGATRLDLISSVLLEADSGRAVTFTVERSGRRQSATASLPAVDNSWRVIASLALGLAAILGLWRGGGLPEVRAWTLAAFAYSFHCMVFIGGPKWQVAAGFTALLAGGGLFAPLALLGALLFPKRLRPRRRFVYLAPWVFAGIGPGLGIWMFDEPVAAEVGLLMLFVLNLGFGVAMLAILVHKFRRANPIEKRQLKWVLYGFFVGLGPVAAAAGLRVFDSDFALIWLYQYSLAATGLIPPCVLIAVHRFNFLDINRLFTATLLYSILLALFLGGLVGLVPWAAEAISETTRLDEGFVRAALPVLLAGALLAGGRYVHPVLLRWVAPESHRLEVAVKQMRSDLGRFEEPGALLEELGKRLAEALRLESCLIYGRTKNRFDPIFVRGPAVRYAFDAEGSLATALAAADRPLRLATWSAREIERSLGDHDRQALEVVGAGVLVPIRHRGELTGFLCLGEKRSGDVFTPSDLNLLDALADRVSIELARFGPDEVERRQRGLSLRMAELHSCFISYSTVDEEFARKLYADLDAQGVRCWFAPEHLGTGDPWRTAIDESLQRYDKLLVILSSSSLESEWVGYEVQAALRRQQGDPEAKNVVFPVRIDESIRDAQEGWPAEVRENVHIGDFRAWENEDAYRDAFSHLLQDLVH